MLVKLSSRQFAILTTFSKRSFSLDEARALNQVSFGALLHREYLVFRQKTKRFHITNSGVSALQEYKEVEIKRKLETRAFTHYFSEQKIARVITLKKVS